MTDEEMEKLENQNSKISKYLRKEIKYLEKHNIEPELVQELKKVHDYFALPSKWYDKDFR